MNTNLNIDDKGIYSSNKYLFKMTDSGTELGLGTDLDLSGHNIKQGNNVMYNESNGIANFPNGTNVDNKTEVPHRIYFNEHVDLKNSSIYNYNDKLMKFDRNNRSLYLRQPINIINLKYKTVFILLKTDIGNHSFIVEVINLLIFKII